MLYSCCAVEMSFCLVLSACCSVVGFVLSFGISYDIIKIYLSVVLHARDAFRFLQ